MIDKNEKGIIRDTVLRRQLEQIEQELTKLNAEYYSLPEMEDDLGGLLDLTREYLENPGAVWLKATFIQKLQLQWFEFPEGVVYENGEFRTTEIVSVSKVKDVSLPNLSSNVRDAGLEPATFSV